MSTASHVAPDSRKAGVQQGSSSLLIVIGVLALFGLTLCAVFAPVPATDDLSQTQLIGP